jgi:hypothetical protein
VAGIALIALGIACWPGPPLVGMLTYSSLVTLYLGYLVLAGDLTGVLLWPAVILHVIHRFLDVPAAARLSGANTKVGGRFGMKGCGPSCRHTRNASAVFKIFVLHPKKTFATISARLRHAD